LGTAEVISQIGGKMNARIEKAMPDTEKLKLRPIWVIVEPKTKKFSFQNAKTQKKETYEEKSVLCNIGIIDYQNRKDAQRIAESIVKALKEL